MAYQPLPITFIGAIVLAVPLYLLALIFYRLYLHPLSKYPGPKLAAISTLYRAYHQTWRDGRLVENLAGLHQSYGKCLIGEGALPIIALTVQDRPCRSDHLNTVRAFSPRHDHRPTLLTKLSFSCTFGIRRLSRTFFRLRTRQLKTKSSTIISGCPTHRSDSKEKSTVRGGSSCLRSLPEVISTRSRVSSIAMYDSCLLPLPNSKADTFPGTEAL